MKLVKNFTTAALLVFALSLTTYAGDQQTPGYVAPPPPPLATVTAPASTNEPAVNCGTQVPNAEPDTADILWYDAVIALLSVF